jgi:hypothetical protein
VATGARPRRQPLVGEHRPFSDSPAARGTIQQSDWKQVPAKVMAPVKRPIVEANLKAPAARGTARDGHTVVTTRGA